jgi:hypothetical protein
VRPKASGAARTAQEKVTIRTRVHKNAVLEDIVVDAIPVEYQMQTGQIVYPLQIMQTTSNMVILERFESKELHMIVNAPWYVPNTAVVW